VPVFVQCDDERRIEKGIISTREFLGGHKISENEKCQRDVTGNTHGPLARVTHAVYYTMNPTLQHTEDTHDIEMVSWLRIISRRRIFNGKQRRRYFYLATHSLPFALLHIPMILLRPSGHRLPRNTRNGTSTSGMCVRMRIRLLLRRKAGCFLGCI
jgi:hypothetical protein